jgi:hypothetical protein
MKKPNWIVLAFLLAALILGLAACGGEETPTAAPTEVGQAAADTPVPEPTDTPVPPTDTPVPEPTDTPIPPTDTPQPTEEAAEELDVGGLEQPADLDSFRSTFAISWDGTATDGSAVSGSMELFIEFVREPRAQHIGIGGDFPGLEELGVAEGTTMEIYVVEDTMYMNLFGSWLQMPADEESTAEFEDMAFVASEDMLQDLSDITYEGRETYNGIETKHYSFDETSFDPADMEGMEIEEASGNVYIAVDGNYVVHMDVSMTGLNLALPTGDVDQTLQNGTMDVMLDLYDINEPFTIELPEEALSAEGLPFTEPEPGEGVPADMPIPDDAEELYASPSGLITFESPSSTEELADFYQTEMPTNGWTEIKVEQIMDMFDMEYSKDNRTATFTIAPPAEGSDRATVFITIVED